MKSDFRKNLEIEVENLKTEIRKIIENKKIDIIYIFSYMSVSNDSISRIPGIDNSSPFSNLESINFYDKRKLNHLNEYRIRKEMYLDIKFSELNTNNKLAKEEYYAIDFFDNASDKYVIDTMFDTKYEVSHLINTYKLKPEEYFVATYYTDLNEYVNRMGRDKSNYLDDKELEILYKYIHKFDALENIDSIIEKSIPKYLKTKDYIEKDTNGMSFSKPIELPSTPLSLNNFVNN